MNKRQNKGVITTANEQRVEKGTTSTTIENVQKT
jgi:hypothetical protein